MGFPAMNRWAIFIPSLRDDRVADCVTHPAFAGSMGFPAMNRWAIFKPSLRDDRVADCVTAPTVHGHEVFS